MPMSYLYVVLALACCNVFPIGVLVWLMEGRERQFAAERARWEQERARLLEQAVPGLVLPGKPEIISHRRQWDDKSECDWERGQRGGEA